MTNEFKEKEIMRGNYREYYNGNAAKALNAIPDNWEEGFREREELRKAERDVRRSRREAQRAELNFAREIERSRSYLVFMSVAVMVVALFSIGYIKFNSDLTMRLNNISKLEKQVSNLTASNDSLSKRLGGTVLLSDIRDIAINEYGMVYPSDDQIVYYHIDNSDYMIQYK